MSITAPATTASARLGGLVMTGALLLICTAGLAATSIQAHPHAPSVSVVGPPAH